MKGIFIIFVFLVIVIRGFSQKDKDFIVFNTDSKIIYDICFSDNGKVLVIADNKTIKAYSTEENELINEFKGGHKKQILSIDISEDSTLLVSGGKDSIINIWDFFTNQILKTLNYHEGIITGVKISPNRKYLASGGTDCKVIIYDLYKNQIINEFNDHKDDIASIAFNPNSTMLASASADKTINIYDLISGKLITSLAGHKNWVRDLSWSSDGNELISCGDDSKIIIWNVRDINNIHKQNISKIGVGWLLSIQFNEDNKTYATGGINGKAWIITPFSQYSAKIKYPINKILFKPDEKVYLKIALATRGNGVILISANNMDLKNYK
jgi:WD40 repeat protein